MAEGCLSYRMARLYVPAQLVYGLEHLVEVTVAKKIPAAAAATTLIARLANNVIGGENFIDMARWTGIQ